MAERANVLDRLRRWMTGGDDDTTVRVHLMLRGRIGDGWMDVDEVIPVQPGTTLAQFIEVAGRRGIALADAIAQSPHLAHTLMLNGERCPVDEAGDRVLADGDELYLLAPLAGG